MSKRTKHNKTLPQEDLKGGSHQTERSMDKTNVQERLTLLKQELQQAVRIVNAYEGAIQDCEFWLAELDKPAETPPEKTD